MVKSTDCYNTGEMRLQQEIRFTIRILPIKQKILPLQAMCFRMSDASVDSGLWLIFQFSSFNYLSILHISATFCSCRKMRLSLDYTFAINGLVQITKYVKNSLNIFFFSWRTL